MALALSLSAAALLMGHSSRASAVTAGLLLAAAALAQPLLPLLAVAVAAFAVRATAVRIGVCLGVAAALAAPALARLGRTLSAREAVAILRSPRPPEVLHLGTSLAVLALAALLAWRVAMHRPRPGVLAAALLMASAAGVLGRAHAHPASGQLSSARLEALGRLVREGRPLEAVCASEDVVDWVPALAGRRAGRSGPRGAQPWVPPVLRDEMARRSAPQCATWLEPPERIGHIL
jgi:uncharacterized low-complexity protein